MIMERFRLL